MYDIRNRLPTWPCCIGRVLVDGARSWRLWWYGSLVAECWVLGVVLGEARAENRVIVFEFDDVLGEADSEGLGDAGDRKSYVEGTSTY